jgi:hypothetical protein
VNENHVGTADPNRRRLRYDARTWHVGRKKEDISSRIPGDVATAESSPPLDSV